MRPRIGISSCLLGENVRYDGGHKRDRFLTDTLGQYCEWVPVCPEVELGLGVPRETIRLAGDPAAPRLVAPASGRDLTRDMHAFNKQRLKALEQQGLHGYILKKGSPTCGMERVKVWHEGGGGSEKKGVGLFAKDLMEALPLLPVEEEGRLNDPRLRENFIERVFCYYRWRELRAGRPRRGDLVRFHTDHKLTLMAHHPVKYRALGRLVADIGERPLREVLDEYGRGFMDALRFQATARKHANVLYHLLGFLKKRLDGEDRQEIVECIESYRKGLVPLVVPVTLLRHHFRRHPADWVDRQVYLHPYPVELMLRNHV